MIEIYPPYTEEQLAGFAENVDCPPPAGYPDRENRLFLSLDAVQRQLDGNVMWLDTGHDAYGSPNRSNAPADMQAAMDPEIITGSNARFTPRVPYAPETIRDQHGRPLHPGFRQLLSLISKDGRQLGMPTGIGAFYRYGANGVADNAGFYRTGANRQTETLLIRRPGTPQSPQGGWATPGGYEEPADFVTGTSSAAITCARRETTEEAGIAPLGRGVVVARMLPVSSVHTLNAWSETHAVIFPEEDQNYLHDVEPAAGPGVEDAAWFPVREIVTGGVQMWSKDHILYIREGYKTYRQLRNGQPE